MNIVNDQLLFKKGRPQRPEQVTVAIKQPSAMPLPQTEDAAYRVH
jgi:hypothetical protein